MNPDGKIILKAEYDSIGFTDENLYETLKAGKTKLFNTAGEAM